MSINVIYDKNQTADMSKARDWLKYAQDFIRNIVITAGLKLLTIKTGSNLIGAIYLISLVLLYAQVITFLVPIEVKWFGAKKRTAALITFILLVGGTGFFVNSFLNRTVAKITNAQLTVSGH